MQWLVQGERVMEEAERQFGAGNSKTNLYNVVLGGGMSKALH